MNNIVSKSVIIKESSDQQGSIYKIGIPVSLLDGTQKQNLDEFITLKVGYSEYKAQPVANYNDNSIEIPKSLMKDLGLYNGLRCNAHIDNGKLSLGPVVAIFMSQYAIRKANNQKVSSSIKEYIKANETAQCIIYLFCINDVDFIKHRVNGTIYNSTKSVWESRSFPFPDVLYDRGGSRNKYLYYVTDYIRSQFDKMDELKKINAQSYFDKYYLYETLSKHPDMKSHLPLTKMYSKNRLRELFKENKTLYIKARIGSNGRSIMRVEKVSRKEYRYSTARNEIVSNIVGSIDELIEEIYYFFNDRPLIIQTQIDLLKIEDCLVDMRATLQRDYEGKLRITTYVVRIGQLDSPVTSTASGSSVYSFEDFFKFVMKYSVDEIKSTKLMVDEFLTKAYKYLEEEYGSFGEMGIDFGLDDEGKLWFIESNSKPAKTTIHLLDDKEILKNSYLYPLEYAKYLASFHGKSSNPLGNIGTKQKIRRKPKTSLFKKLFTIKDN